MTINDVLELRRLLWEHPWWVVVAGIVVVVLYWCLGPLVKSYFSEKGRQAGSRGATDAESRPQGEDSGGSAGGVGGVVGEHLGGEITNCTASGEIDTDGSAKGVGGLVGRMNGGRMENCHWHGKIINRKGDP